MKSRKPSRGVMGAIIVESVLFLEVAVELYTKEKSLSDLMMIIAISLLLAIPFVMIMRRKRKNRYGSPVERTNNNSEADDSKRK